MKHPQIKKLSAAALLSALCFVVMYLGALTGVMDLCSAVFASVVTAIAVIELRGAWPWLMGAVTGVLCLLLLPDKFMALEYIALGALYPIIKAYAESLRPALSWALKLLSLNVLLTACFLCGRYLLGITENWVKLNVIVYILANVFFVFLDYALTVFITYYVQRLRPRLKIGSFLK